MPTAIDRHELQRLLADEQAQLIEVLPEAEFADEHLPGAINIPLKQLDASPPSGSTARTRSSSTATTRNEI